MGTEAEYPVFIPGDIRQKTIYGETKAEKLIRRELLDVRNLPEGIVSSYPNYVNGKHGMTNMLNNGDRLYPEVASDAMIEVSTGERSGPLATMLCDQRGIFFARQVAANVARRREESHAHPVNFYLPRRTRDTSGKTTGHHINESIPLRLLIAEGPLSPLFAAMVGMPALAGAGFLNDDGSFEVHQKSAQVCEYIMKETTLPRKPLINYRDEPHADRKRFQRLHIVGNDILHSPWATWLRLGVYEILTTICEEDPETARKLVDRLPQNLESAVKKFSADTEFTVTTLGADGNSYALPDYLDMAGDLIDTSIDRGVVSVDEEDAERAYIHREFNWARDKVREDPEALDNLVDWRYRRNFLETARAKGYTTSQLQALEIKLDDVCDRNLAVKYQASIRRCGFERISEVMGVSVEFLEDRATDIHYVEPGGRAELIAKKVDEAFGDDTRLNGHGDDYPIRVDWEGWSSEDGRGFNFLGEPGSQEITYISWN